MRDVRQDFPLLRRQVDGKPIIYLDSSATSLKPQSVIDAVTRYYTQCTSNVHRAMHVLAEEATEAFEATRIAMARFLNADEDEIIFTRGSTEAINMVHRCCPGLERCVTTAMEHHSNLLPWAFGDQATIVPVDLTGQLDEQAFDAALAKGVDLVAVTHVSNVLGAITDLKPLIDKAHDAGAKVLVDAAQSVPHMPIDVQSLDVDFLVCSGHKMLGPGGVGVLYGKIDLLEEFLPWHLGGNVVDQVYMDRFTMQELPHRLEAGTPAIEAIIGFGAAIEYLDDLGMDAVRQHDQHLVTHAMNRLSKIEHVNLIGPTDPSRRAASVTFNVTGLEAHGTARMLSNRSNILVRSGFHCAQPLHESLDLLPTVRASFYIYNTTEEIDALAEALESITSFIRS